MSGESILVTPEQEWQRRGRLIAADQLWLGLKLKKRGQEKVASVSSEWIEKALDHIRRCAPGVRFTAETIRADFGEPPHPNAMGALFSFASRYGWIEFVGYSKAQRPSRHANRNGRWRRT